MVFFKITPQNDGKYPLEINAVLTFRNYQNFEK
jgi:hypothetical protein